MDLSWQAIKSADAHIQRWRSKVQGSDAGTMPTTLKEVLTDLWLRDLDTPQVLATLFEVEKTLPTEDFAELLRWADSLLGFDLVRTTVIDVPDNVSELVKKREQARASKNWTLSDEIRAEIESLGFEVKDSADGPTITRKLRISE